MIGLAFATMGRLEALDRMSVNDKLTHFARRDAFRLPRKPGENRAGTMRLPRRGLPTKLTPGCIDATGGNVTRQAYPVVGRPCFGIPTARLIHGREYIIRDDGKLAFARCGECPIKAACQFIVDERLNANDRIREAHREFQRRGGAKAFWSRDRSRSVGAALQQLVRELQAAGFTTINDAQVIAHYDKRAQDRRAMGAKRQRAFRDAMANEAKAASQPLSRASLVIEAKALQQRIEAAQKAPGCPRWLSEADAAWAAQVWAVRAALSSRGDKHGATHIARVLASAAQRDVTDALRFRVARVLKRLPQIEALPEHAQHLSQAYTCLAA